MTRELRLQDHVGYLYAIQGTKSYSERLEPTHVPHAPFDETAILLDFVVEIFGHHDLYFGWAAKALQDSVYVSNACCICTTLVYDEFVCDPVCG